MRYQNLPALTCAIESLETRRLLSTALMSQSMGEFADTYGYVEFNDKLLFLSSDFNQSTKLWVSDGTIAGTQLVHTFNHPTGALYMPSMTIVNDRVLLAVNDGTHGFELWKTDGTSAGTQLLVDIYPGAESSALEFGLQAGGIHYFYANDGTHGDEPWRTDGTAAGTYMVKDIEPGTVGSQPPSPDGIAFPDGVLYFASQTSANGVELWRSDGSTSGTYIVKDIVAGEDGASPSDFAAVNGGFVFASFGDLYFSDGSAAGTKLLYSFDESWLTGFTELSNGKLLFRAAGLSKGHELWVTDGTVAGTTLVKDIKVGFESSYPIVGEASASGAYALFAVENGNGGELWRTDGTTAGTYIVKDLNPGVASDHAYVEYADGATTYVSLVINTDSYDPGAANTTQLWKTNGTAAGTVKLGEWQTDHYWSGISMMTRHTAENRLYFTMNTTAHGSELWTTDGTAAGTHIVQDLNPGTATGVEEIVFAEVGDSQLFFGNTGAGLRLFTTGTGEDPVVTPVPEPLVINGTTGNDIISIRRSGANIVYRINDVDTSVAAELVTSITINGLDGADHIRVDDTLDEAVTINGGTGNDSLYGSALDDVIAGGDGDDLIYGFDGNDNIIGEDGLDTIYGNFGDDVIAGGLKRDSILAGIGNDVVTAGDGPDTVLGGDGTDVLRGGKGADYMDGRGKSDTMYGGIGNDSLIGGAGADAIYGETEDDFIDVSRASVFHDTLDGGAGYDSAYFDLDDIATSIEGLLA